ncbi:MAG: hypothetical protein ACJ76U_16395 [Gaiellaceae bacterium]|jgi:hypothetical protein
MPLLRGRRGDDGGTKYQMREKAFTIGDDYWIETDGGERVFKVNGKAFRVRDTFVLETPGGEELFTAPEAEKPRAHGSLTRSAALDASASLKARRRIRRRAHPTAVRSSASRGATPCARSARSTRSAPSAAETTATATSAANGCNAIALTAIASMDCVVRTSRRVVPSESGAVAQASSRPECGH